MQIVRSCAAQGDILFRRVDRVPAGAVEMRRIDGQLVVGHSETGHHHSIADRAVTGFEVPGDPLVCYLRMDDGLDPSIGGVDAIHHRAWHTHETLRLVGKPGDVWQVRRQREWAPEGWRRVQD